MTAKDTNGAKAAAAAKAGTKATDPAPMETVLDDTNSEPATTVPGDAPYDTTDPSERASTVTPDPGPEALAVGTVNGVRKLADADAPASPQGKGRIERYKAIKPNGEEVAVEHNLDTGETKLV